MTAKTIYFCNRCGKEVDKATGIIIRMADWEHLGEDDRHDLCGECWPEFCAFWQSGAKSEKPDEDEAARQYAGYRNSDGEWVAAFSNSRRNPEKPK